jgi:thioredoxin-related protein
MKKTILFLLTLIVITTTVKAQNTGIHFENELNWDKILSKAKSEHKYLFVDCYATWCAPCKAMDNDVYSNDKVGKYMNEHFISVKVQMDKTKSDNDNVKNWYGLADMFQTNFTVNAYPAFLFFDPDNKPVHKAIGGLDTNGFLQLARDAQNPEKQYYRILKNFSPSTIDTADLKGLAWSVIAFDKQLAHKLALDYLLRIPKLQYDFPDNRQLMRSFKDDPQILDLAASYIEGLDRSKFTTKENLSFISNFSKIQRIITIVKTYINQLPEDSLYTKSKLQLIATFTNEPTDRGFLLFYHHAAKVNGIMNDNYFASGKIIDILIQKEFNPLFEIAKKTEVEPDWEAISKNVIKKYNADYAVKVIINSKVGWFSYLARTKKEDRYWPQYINARIGQMEKFKYDTVSARGYFNNAFAWEIFEHGTDNSQLMIAADWMKNTVVHEPKIANYWDTYANLLYKADRQAEAILLEERALQLNPRDKEIAESLKKMQAGHATWPSKEQ